MGYTAFHNKLGLDHLREHASPDWASVADANEAGKQGLRMEAVLKLVLLYHSGEPWDDAKKGEWHNLQVEAGMQDVRDATTRGLCNVVREVLGIEPNDTNELQRFR
jgi:hypothetical protein